VEVNLETELKREYKDVGVWFDQAGNIIYSIGVTIGIWLGLSSILAALSLTSLFITGSLESMNYGETLYLVKVFVVWVVAVAAVVAVLFRLPKK